MIVVPGFVVQPDEFNISAQDGEESANHQTGRSLNV